MQTNPFPNWSRKDSNLLKASLHNNPHPRVSVVEACERAVEIVDSGSSITGKYAIPLFEPNAPHPTEEFVFYKPKSEKIRFHDEEKGYARDVSPDEIATTELGQRLQWWLPEIDKDIETLNDDQIPPESVPSIDPLSDSEITEFFGEMKGFVEAERRAEKKGAREEFETLGLDSAIARGVMSGPLIPTGTGSHGGGKTYKFQLIHPEDAEEEGSLNLRDDAGIFEDNQYIVGVRGHENVGTIEMEAVHVGDRDLWLSPVSGSIPSDSPQENALTDDEVTIWVYDLLNPVPFNRRAEAIRSVEQNHEKKALLSGNREARFSASKYSVPDPPIELNSSQEKALIWARAANDCLCIHGPPGTGKTRTLTAYIAEAVANGRRVLVTAHSNQAVDNLLVGDSSMGNPEEETLHAMAQDDDFEISIARSGNNSENRVVQNYYQGKSVGSADVVAATTSGAATFDSNQFDVGIVDEATQASRAATAIVFNVSRKLILAGDHKQLPPYAASDDFLGDEQRLSLFETLMNRYGEDIAVMLRTQYRMNETIASFPNDAFYDGKLKTAEKNRDWTIGDLSPLMGIHVQGREISADTGHSRYNPAEAEAAAKQVKLLLDKGVSADDIGVIAAYSRQVREIREKLRHLDIENVHNVSVNTVDAFQGSEREAIIVSLVRSNETASSGFLTAPDEGPRRLNVAITRGRKRLVVIGNWDTLGNRPDYRAPDESSAELYSMYEDHIRGLGLMLDIDSK